MSKRILLITPVFYGLEDEIKRELENEGHEVVWIENKILAFDYHGTDSKLRFLRRVYFYIFFPQKRFLKKELNRIQDIRFDILFSINAQIVSPFLLEKLKSKNASLFTILYLWDAFSKYSFKKEQKYFDKVYTFDWADSIRFGLEYKPNFYISGDGKKSQENEIDIFFTGKYNLFRLSVFDGLVPMAEKESLKCFIKIFPCHKIFPHHRLVYYFFNKFRFNNSWVKNYLMNFEAIEGILKRNYLIKKALDRDEIHAHLIASNVILDLPFQQQTGYTHLLIEALANGKKVITTNSNILKERFFNPEQIHITDGYNIESDIDWIKEKKTFKIDSYFLDLELSHWLKSMINAGVA